MRQFGIDAAKFATVARKHVGQIICRSAALPLMLGCLLRPHRLNPSMHVIGRAHAAQYWKVKSAGQSVDILAAILLWPFGVIISAIWFTSQNGRIVAAIPLVVPLTIAPGGWFDTARR